MFRILGVTTYLSPSNNTCTPWFQDNSIFPTLALGRRFCYNGFCPPVALIARTSPVAWPSRQDISGPVSRPGTVLYREIKLLNKVQPARLLGNWVFRTAEVTECSMISSYQNLAPQNISSKTLESKNHGDQLLARRAIGHFGSIEQSASISNHPQLSTLVLMQNGTGSVNTGIHIQYKITVWNRSSRDRRGTQPNLQSFKCLTAPSIPNKRCPFSR